MTKAKELRRILNSNEPIIAPGAYDSVSARMIEKVGFNSVYMTGYGVSGSLIGKPDIGLITGSEMAQQAGNMASAINVPLIADADNGYGNELNVTRTMEIYEKQGVAAIQFEDQGYPKKCGHMENKKIIDRVAAVNKIKAAAHARSNPDTIIIARTDARAVVSMDEAIERGKYFAEAGADIIFIEAPLTVEEIHRVSEEFKGVPLLANMVETGKTPLLTTQELYQLGYKLIIYPITGLLTVVKALETNLTKLKEESISQYDQNSMYTFNQFTDLIGLKEYQELEKKISKL